MKPPAPASMRHLQQLADTGGWRLVLRLAASAEDEARAELLGIAAHLGAPEEVDEASEEAHTSSPPLAAFVAWHWGYLAEDAEGEARGRYLDRALDAFEAIARAPIDPGNDEGPMWALAHLLDAPRLRRALHIAEQMEGAGWVYALGGTRAALTGRQAALGDTAAALAAIPTIGGTDTFAPYWRAVAAGGVLAAMQAAAPHATAEQLLAQLPALVLEDDESRQRVLDALFLADFPPPSPEAVRSWLLYAAGLSPRARQLSVECCAARWTGALPAAEWAAACAELVDPVAALIELAEVLPEPTAALEPLLARLEHAPPPVLAEAFPALASRHADLPRPVMRRLWRAWLASEPVPREVLTVECLVEVLVTLEGADAPLQLGRMVLAGHAEPSPATTHSRR